MKLFVPAMGRINTANRDGSEVRFAEIAKIWLQQGIKLHIMLPTRQIKVLKEQGVETDFQDIGEIFKSEKDSLYNVLRIYISRMIQAFFVKYPKDIDVIYSPSDFLVDLIPALISKVKNKNATLIVCLFLLAPNPFHGYENVYSKKKKAPTLRSILYYLTQKISIFLIRKFKGKIEVLNNIDRENVVQSGKLNNEDVITVSMGVKVNEYRNMEAYGNMPGFDGIFVGRLHPQKGLLDLVKIWENVCKKKPDAKLGVIGGGSESWKEKLNKEIKQRKLENNIQLLGFKSGKEKIGYIKNAKCFVMPSHYESWGMVAVEAMASGVPVVAYDLPIFGEIFSNDSMVKIPMDDIEMFAENVLRFINNEALRKEYAKRSMENAERYDWKLVAERELNILES